MTLSYFTTAKFLATAGNPYTEDTRAWHVWIDICVTHLDGEIVEINLERMAEYHSMKPEYYAEPLETLAEDGYLERVNEVRGAK